MPDASPIARKLAKATYPKTILGRYWKVKTRCDIRRYWSCYSRTFAQSHGYSVVKNTVGME